MTCDGSQVKEEGQQLGPVTLICVSGLGVSTLNFSGASAVVGLGCVLDGPRVSFGPSTTDILVARSEELRLETWTPGFRPPAATD